MPLLKRKRPSLIGIDISPSSVKVLELSKEGAQYRVERYAVEPLPQNAIVELAITEIEQVAQTVARAVKRSGTRNRRAALAVPAAHVICKVIQAPANMTDRDLQAQIEMDAERYIPYPLNEVNLDFQRLGPSEAGPEESDVLIAACRKEIIDDYMAVLQGCGMTAEVIDIETYALENAYGLIAHGMAGGGMERTVAIFDIGATKMTLNVMHDLHSVYTHDHNFGGRQLTEEIQRRYGLSYDEAGLAKKQGGLPENYQADVLRPFLEALCQEITRALQFFYSTSSFNSVHEVLLAGGCAQILGIEELVAARIGIPVQVANPFAGMAVSSRVKPQVLSREAPSLMATCGLALRSFDP